jgi:hypothetical protein
VRYRVPIQQDVAGVVGQSSYAFPGGLWGLRFDELIGIELKQISDCGRVPQDYYSSFPIEMQEHGRRMPERARRRLNVSQEDFSSKNILSV